MIQKALVTENLNEAHQISLFHLPPAPSLTCPGCEWVQQMTAVLFQSQTACYLDQEVRQSHILYSNCLQKQKECTKQASKQADKTFASNIACKVTYKILLSYPHEQKFQSLRVGKGEWK
jgi:hypothetical protein